MEWGIVDLRGSDGYGSPMSILVIVQNNPLVQDLTGPVARHARLRGLDMVDLDLSGDLDFAMVPIGLEDRDHVLLHGSVGFLRTALRHAPLGDRLAWNPTAFLASEWQRRFGEGYLGARGRVLTASEVSEALELGQRLAVRPEVGLKDFVGGVHDVESWSKACVPSDTVCFAMPPSDLLSEHRIWFVGGEPVAGARYRNGNVLVRDLEQVREAMAEAGALVNGNLPLEDVVVDVAMTPVGWRIIELNCIHTSGWYAINPGVVLDALTSRPVPGRAFV